MTQSNAVVWFDIYVEDMDRAVDFYQTVLGYKLTEMGDPTGESQMMGFPSDESSPSRYGALGALTKLEGVRPSRGGTLVYFGSEDCAVEESRVVEAGGAVIRPKFSIGEFGWVTVCQDSEGNMFGLNSKK